MIPTPPPPQQPQQTTLNPQRTEAALRTGLKLLSSETIATPNAWNKDLSALQDIIGGIITGQLMLAPVQPPKAPEDEGKKFIRP